MKLPAAGWVDHLGVGIKATTWDAKEGETGKVAGYYTTHDSTPVDFELGKRHQLVYLRNSPVVGMIGSHPDGRRVCC